MMDFFLLKSNVKQTKIFGTFDIRCNRKDTSNRRKYKNHEYISKHFFFVNKK